MEKVNRLKFLSTDAKLVHITVPDKDDVEKYQLYDLHENWWLMPPYDPASYAKLSHPPRYKYMAGPTPAGSRFYNKLFGVRPLIRFINGATDKNKATVGDEIFIGHWLFRVIDNGIAICETVIDYIPYAKSESDAVSYSTSYLNKYIHHWYDEMVNRPIDKIVKIPCDKAVINFKETRIPSYEDVQDFSDSLLLNFHEYWLRTRTEEFEGMYIDDTGHKRIGKLTDKHYICPIVFFNREHPDYEKLDISSKFEIQGRVFKFATSWAGIGICWNPIGLSCYSTGISEIGNSEEETEFYKSSEACEIVDNWLKTL